MPKLKPPGTKRSKLYCDILLSTSTFKLNLRRYILGIFVIIGIGVDDAFVFFDHLEHEPAHGQGLTLVHCSAQPEPFLTLDTT
jgi:hypothetical protein